MSAGGFGERSGADCLGGESRWGSWRGWGVGLARLAVRGGRREGGCDDAAENVVWLDRPAYPVIALLVGGTVLASVACIAVLDGYRTCRMTWRICSGEDIRAGEVVGARAARA